MLNPFAILREMARAAVAAGIHDAVRDVAPPDTTPADLSPYAPRALAPAPDETSAKGRKAKKPAEAEAAVATPEPQPAAG